MQDLLNVLRELFGVDVEPKSFTVWQMVARASAIYLIGWFLLRAGEHRFLGKNTAFDVVLGFVFGSLLSRAINGAGPMAETIVAGITLLALHWAFVSLAYYSTRMDELINGPVRRLISGGKVDKDSLKRARLNDRILRENLRLNGGVSEPSEVKEADYEPSGNVSVVRRRDAQVVEVSVHEGVQTVRVEFG